ncbi:CMT1A duplicated region transcript 4 protein [Phacochoerus africanus]|uniref:CMT1A duplicated region transcript 4 protein n=1 Tax=Phacochoerus africanus TaxID=41426 RepID=UPI001FD900F3|nr:CMT1A duplicated region transcript 4 protein [Phacochoerus africanus]XP_047614386.1 CMT1A duplicated region transcript 4 protein [Phacochoerus africanus]
MNHPRDLQKFPRGRSGDPWPSERGIWTFKVKNAAAMERTDAGKPKLDEDLTGSTGLPGTLLEKHDPWPAYVTYISPKVRKLIQKSQARELECLEAMQESRRARRPSTPASLLQPKRRKSSKASGHMTFKDMRSEARLSAWGPFSVLAAGSTAIPVPVPCHADSRASPTADSNKIIFSRKPTARVLPGSSRLTSTQRHSGG